MKKILLADDHSYIRLGLIKILKDEYPTLEIKEVSNGHDLINEVMKNDYDLVISDLEMPDKNGLEALEDIKHIKPQLPVLILSFFTEDIYAIRVLRAGASGYLNKNSAPYELVSAIEKIRLGRKYITPEIAEKILEKPDSNNPHELLSNREFEIFKMLAKGKSVSQIADHFFIGSSTVSTYRNRILSKLGLATNSELTRYAIQHHIISDIDL